MTRDIIGLIGGGIMEVHDPAACAGQACCVHNPSDHPLRDAPLDWWPVTRIMVRVCSHKVPHPDPDDRTVLRMGGFFSHHLCDGCCQPDGRAPVHHFHPPSPLPFPPGRGETTHYPRGETP